jgi:hypothetical protein
LKNDRFKSRIQEKLKKRDNLVSMESDPIEISRHDGKIAWRRWRTHKLVTSRISEAAMIICGRHDGVIDHLRCVDERKSSRRN